MPAVPAALGTTVRSYLRMEGTYHGEGKDRGTYGTSIDTVPGGTMKRQSTRTNVVSLHKMNQKVQAA